MNSEISIKIKQISHSLIPNEKNGLSLVFVITDENSTVYQYVSDGVKEGFISFDTQFLMSLSIGDQLMVTTIKKRVGTKTLIKILKIIFEEENKRKVLNDFY